MDGLVAVGPLNFNCGKWSLNYIYINYKDEEGDKQEVYLKRGMKTVKVKEMENWKVDDRPPPLPAHTAVRRSPAAHMDQNNSPDKVSDVV